MQTFEEWLASNAPAATKSEKALARRAWEATHQTEKPASPAKKAPKKTRVTRNDGEAA